MSDDFVHLHVHSEFSLLDGLGRVDKLVERAKALGQPALALTDHGTMHGVLPFFRACQGAGIRPVIGVEAYLTRWGRPMSGRDSVDDKERHHLLLLAQNQTGYRNLLKICSDAQMRGYYYKPRIDAEYLAQHAEGLICTTGCLAAEVPSLLNPEDGALPQERLALERLHWYLDLFGKDRFFIELQEHDIPALQTVNRTLVDWAARYDVGMVVTNDVHYVEARDAAYHDVLLCVQTGALARAQDRMRMPGGSYYLKSGQEMRDLFRPLVNLPESAFTNTRRIAEMCQVDLEDKSFHLPDIDIPAGHSYETYLRAMSDDGLRWRYGARADDEAVQARKEHELKIIHQMGFDVYFLIVADLCRYARGRGIWYNVRGSGAGSIVAYATGITGIDPLANNLVFERFLNPGRVSMPDFDLDFPDDQREEMIRYTIDKYGAAHVAQIVSFGRMKARAAVRDVGRALDVPLDEVDRIAKLIPAIPGKPVTIEQALGKDVKKPELAVPELIEQYQQDHVRELLDNAMALEGVARHASTHAAAVIVTDQPLTTYLPVMRPQKAVITEAVTQFEFPICESIGLLKVDFLGLATLTVMREATRLIRERHSVDYTLDNIPLDDPESYRLLSSGEVSGVFQVEGAGLRRMLIDMQPREFNHIVAAISLYRPGPMDFIPDYIAVMHGRKEAEYVHPVLEPILSETYGICVSGDALVMDAATGRRHRLDSLRGVQELLVQGVDADGRPAVGRVTHWIDSGVKQVYEVVLRNGASIKITEDHRLLSESGWLPLKALAPGDFIATPARLFGPEDRGALATDHRRLRVLAYLIADGSLTSSREKFVPEFVFELEPNQIAFFLASLWDSDGYMGRKLCHYKTVSRRLAGDVQTLLLRLGVTATIHQAIYAATDASGAPARAVSYRVTVYDTARLAALLQPYMVSRKRDVLCTGRAAPTIARDQFIDEMERNWSGSYRALMAAHSIDRQHFCADKRLRRRIPAHAVAPVAEALNLEETSRLNVRWEEIRAIEPVGVEPVYDLTVEGLHSFVANNIIVHNCVYQEQVIKLLTDIGGYTAAEADNVRRGISKKSEKVLIQHREIFAQGSKASVGLSRKDADAIWDALMGFARYGFNRAHAADYAVITVQTAHLKARYPLEYMAAMLLVERSNHEKVAYYITESRRMGIEVLPPDINASGMDFVVEQLRADAPAPVGRDPRIGYVFPIPPGAAIRYGLAAIKNVGEGPVQAILDARGQGGAFRSLEELCERVDLRKVGKKALECLIKVGALDQFGERARLLEGIDQMVGISKSRHEAEEAGQMSMFDLFGAAAAVTPASLRLRDVEPMTPKERLAFEKELLGVFVSSHPLQQLAVDLTGVTTCFCGELDETYAGRNVVLAGNVVRINEVTTKKGDKMAFVTLEDLQGQCDVVVFPKVWEATRGAWQQDKIVLVRGKADKRGEQITVMCEGVQDYVMRAVEAGGGAESLPGAQAQTAFGHVSDEGRAAPVFGPPARPAEAEAESDVSFGDNPFALEEPEWLREAPPVFGAGSIAIGEQPERYDAPAAVNHEEPAASSQRDSGRPAPVADQRAPVEVCITVHRSPDAERDKRLLSWVYDTLRGRPGPDRFCVVLKKNGSALRLDFPNDSTDFNDEMRQQLVRRLGAGNVESSAVVR